MIKVVKSDKVEVRASFLVWPPEDGEVVLDIRTYVKTKKSDGKFIPTMKGTQVPLEEAERFARRLLKMVQNQLEAQK